MHFIIIIIQHNLYYCECCIQLFYFINLDELPLALSYCTFLFSFQIFWKKVKPLVMNTGILHVRFYI